MGDTTSVEEFLAWWLTPENMLVGIIVIPLMLLIVLNVLSRIASWVSRSGYRRQQYLKSQAIAARAQARRNERKSA